VARSKPCSPATNVYFQAFDGDGSRFARLFRATWRRIPLWARRRILRYWREDFSGPIAVSPEITLAKSWKGRGRRDFAVTTCHGHRLVFHSRSVAAMPEDVAGDLIAHELAYVLQSVRGIRFVKETRRGGAYFAYPDGSCFGGRMEIEVDADETMDRWGFDSRSIDRWSLATGRSKVLEDTPENRRKVFSRLFRHGR
jgi:hypothetical protein